MLSGVAKDLDHQIRETVHHLGLITKAGSGVNHPEHLHHALHMIEAAERGPHRAEEIESGLPRRVVALLDRDILAELALHTPLRTRGVARDEQQVPGADGDARNSPLARP